MVLILSIISVSQGLYFRCALSHHMVTCTKSVNTYSAFVILYSREKKNKQKTIENSSKLGKKFVSLNDCTNKRFLPRKNNAEIFGLSKLDRPE